jgi:hypothetical protein
MDDFRLIMLCRPLHTGSQRQSVISLSFRGDAGDEESRTAWKNIQSEIPRFARNGRVEALSSDGAGRVRGLCAGWQMPDLRFHNHLPFAFCHLNFEILFI